MDVDKHPTLFCPLSPPSANYTILWYLLNFQIHCNLVYASAAAAKSLQSCPTLCDPMDCSLPGFSIPGILQARTLEWVAISFSNAWKWKVKVKSLSHVLLLATPWTAAHQAPPSMGFSRQEYWSGVPLPSPQLWGLCEAKQCSDFPNHWGTSYDFSLSGLSLLAEKWVAACSSSLLSVLQSKLSEAKAKFEW